MDTKLIAKILPTKKDGKRSVGTGYPIGKGLVLTARHVVFPHWTDTQKVEVEWPDLNHKAAVTDIVFDGGIAAILLFFSARHHSKRMFRHGC
ncbi:MAG: hypothetical protein HZT40_11870 [Candidatus Thiothrix singaporensis]|uniref:Serine protease n=1 Tax=Candidatus Thiothrix singaporensis TaxID=2799669 RepID=A0A7L6ASV6_9GAMM|nr:MAG: hypothetical protein HZT40_11870 [Candidatus Thiothrix singaporensis]